MNSDQAVVDSGRESGTRSVKQPWGVQYQRGRGTYRDEARETEAGAAVEPVIVAELVNLDASLIRRLMRHRLCHHQRFGRRLSEDVAIGDQVWCDLELMGRKRQFGLGRAEESKGRHRLGGWRAPRGSAFCRRRAD